MRITKSLIKDLGIYTIGFGALVGIAFPFFVLLFGVPVSIVLSPIFIIACTGAGLVVGVVNIGLSRMIVIERLKTTTKKMWMIKDNVISAAQGFEHGQCDFEICTLPVDSEDAIGQNAEAYNQLVETLSVTMAGREWLSLLDIKSIASISLTEILDATHSTAGCVFMEREGDLEVLASFGIKEAEKLALNKSVLSVASTRKPVRMELPENILIDGILTDIRPREILVEPLLFNSIHIGAILVASTKPYHAGSLDRLRIQMNSLSLALHNAIVHEQIKELAAIDPLTSVFNRRFGMSRLVDEISRSIRNESPLGVAMLDLDHFKNVNDNFGHMAGDKVLVSCAKIVRGILREGDLVLRYGGEEFLLVLPGASFKDLHEITDKIRRLIEESVVRYSEFEIKVTCSIGIASIPECRITGQEELLLKVDEAMYQAKRNGRNRICMVNA